jgi:hypothetical protein
MPSAGDFPGRQVFRSAPGPLSAEHGGRLSAEHGVQHGPGAVLQLTGSPAATVN